MFHNSVEKINKLKGRLANVNFVNTDYSQEAEKQPQDIFIMFNRSKDSDVYRNYADVIKITSYIRKNLCDHGYAILGNC